MGAGDDVTTFGVRIQGAGGINKSGTGTLVLGGNTLYTGATTITGGTLEIGANGRLGSGAYSANLTNNSTFIYSGTNNQTLSGTIRGTGNMTKNAASTLTLSGNNSYSGTTTINGGTLKVASAGALGQAEAIVVNTGGSLLIGVDNSIGDSTDIALNGGTIKFEGDRNESVGALTLSADSIIDMSGGDIHLEFAILYATLESYNLKIYNYSLYNDHLYFNGSTYVNESLPRIQFYSDAGNTLIGDSFIRDFGVTNEVCPVPEPGVYATGLLLMGLMFYYQYRKKQNV
jgi:autotransporter-associated beta strand protein